MKVCSKCKVEKPLSKFSKRSKSKDGHSASCKECYKKVNAIHYLKNIEVYKDNSYRSKIKYREWWVDYKSKLMCSKCGESKYWRLDFHHTNPEEKETEIAALVNMQKSYDIVLKEISKCIVLCKNCHADEHHNIER